MRFILWDPCLGAPTINEDGTFRSAGILGELPADNVYLTTYADYLDADRRHTDLGVGESISARFRLSGESGVYQVWRVK